MKTSLYLRTAWRESRGARGRMLFFVACLAVGVAAVVAVASLASSLDTAVRSEARQLLAADLKIRGNQPLPETLQQDLATLAEDAGIDADALERTNLKELVTVVARWVPEQHTDEAVPGGQVPASASAPPTSQLSELKVVDGTYPFYGTLDLQPDQPLTDLLRPDTTVVAADLLPRLGIDIGDSLSIGGKAFRIAGVVLSEPDRVTFSLTLGPRVFLSTEGLARTNLETLGSRVRYSALIRLPDGSTPPQLRALAAALNERLGGPEQATSDDTRQADVQSDEARREEVRREEVPQEESTSDDGVPEGVFRVETYVEAQPSLRQGLRRVERYLGLVALLSLLIGGVGVAQTVRAWLAGRLDAVAILKCLGMRPREVFALYLGQTAVLGLAGSLAGMLIGAAVPALVPYVLGDLIDADAINPWQPAALLRGLVLGLGVALLFSLPPLASVLRVPPVRVLRRAAEPLPPARRTERLTAAALLLGVLLMAVIQSGGWTLEAWKLGAAFTAGLALVTALLMLAARGVQSAVARLPRERLGTAVAGSRARLYLRQGLSALARPGAGTSGAMVALGLGVLVVLSMSLVQSHLAGQLDAELPAEAPSVFLVDIQPDQWSGVQERLDSSQAEDVDSVPVVTARLAAIDGRRISELLRSSAPEDRGRRWALTREQRLTWLDHLPDDNRLVEQTSPDATLEAPWQLPDVLEATVDTDFAENLGIDLGSTLTFDVQGVELTLTVSSLREIRWESFGLNFFLVAEPQALEAAPHFRVATAQVAAEAEQGLQDSLAAAFPNVTVLRVRAILEKVIGVLERLGLGVRFLGAFTILAGLAILAGAVSAGAARRGREVALLKTLGTTRAGVAAMFAVEYTLIGLVAGLIGAAGGGVLAWAVLEYGMDIDYGFQLLPFLITVVGITVLTLVAGLAASWSALQRRPIDVLRQAE